MNKNSAESVMILIPISIGELIDKISILKIKEKEMKGDKLINVNRELNVLEAKLIEKNLKIDPKLISKLSDVNLKLWDIENKIRSKEISNEFDYEFVQLARSVYQQNDKRASIKRKINFLYNSHLVEEKSYYKDKEI